MGFEQGRDPVDRADAFSLDASAIRKIQRPGNQIPTLLTENTDLVSEKTAAIHGPLRDALAAIDWTTSRLSYSAFLTIRNATRAIIRIGVGSDPTVAGWIGLAAGLSALLGDGNLEFVRASATAMMQIGPQLLAFFSHNPEMRNYVDYGLRLLEADQQKH